MDNSLKIKPTNRLFYSFVKPIFLLACFLFAPLALVSCKTSQLPISELEKNPLYNDNRVKITILATTDVHGWINPYFPNSKETKYEGGLANLAGLWRAKEGYSPEIHKQKKNNDGFLILDSGDMWTGPAESTLANGVPVVEAFNNMAYDAAALGNHEFDFGLNILKENAKKLLFPLLSSNITRKPNGPLLDFFKQSTIINVNGIKFGVIGISTLDTPTTTLPSEVEGLGFESYEDSIRKEARKLQQKGIDYIVILAHESLEKLEPAISSIKDLPIKIVLGGHNHIKESKILDRNTSNIDDDVLMLTAGRFARYYGKITLLFDKNKNKHNNNKYNIISHNVETVNVASDSAKNDIQPDPIINEIGKKAKEKVQEKLAEKIGFAKTNFEIGTLKNTPLGTLLNTSWLDIYPQAEISLSNLGGLRQPIRAGDITFGDVFGALPFNNNLVLVKITGKDLLETIAEIRNPITAGMSFDFIDETPDSKKRTITKALDSSGNNIIADKIYSVITTDFLYDGGDGTRLKEMDKNPKYLGVNWREPLIQYIKKHKEGISNSIHWDIFVKYHFDFNFDLIACL